MPRTIRPAVERFEGLVVFEPNSGCWLWGGAIKPNGYGIFGDQKKTWNAHRWSYEFYVGPIPSGLELDHLCRVRCCVNPWHLEPVTGIVNRARGIGAQATKARWAAMTHCRRGHEFTPENTRVYRGARHCRTCNRDWQRERYRGVA